MLVLSQYVELGLAMKLLADSAEGVGYLLKDRISDVDDFVGRCGAWRTAARRSIPIIVSTLLSGGATTTRWPSSPRGSARSSS